MSHCISGELCGRTFKDVHVALTLSSLLCGAAGLWDLADMQYQNQHAAALDGNISRMAAISC
jgi:hypothetical protein